MKKLNNKTVVVINGSGETGKDTLCEFIAEYYRTRNVSSIDPYKSLAIMLGWDLKKDEKSRKFLSDLKHLSTEFNDFPQTFLVREYQDFLESNDTIMFVHIREPEEIEKFKKNINGNCITLLIRRDIDKKWNNSSDDNVENYEYDLVYNNNLPLENAKFDFLEFFEKLLLHK